MNILFTYCTPFHPQRGGIGRVTDTLTREFQRRGHKVFYLIYPGLMNPFGVEDTDDFEFPTPINYTPSRELMSQENIDFYKKFLIDNKIDIVINQSGDNSEACLWEKAREHRIPMISCIHQNIPRINEPIWSNINFLRNNKLIEKFKLLARCSLYFKIKRENLAMTKTGLDWIIENSDLVCLLSEKTIENFKSYFNDLNSNHKLISICNPNSYHEEVLSEINFDKKKKQLLFVGLFNVVKRPDRLIKIWRKLFKKHPDWEMVIVGNDDSLYAQRIKKLGSKLPRIKFEGIKNNSNFYFKQASIFCLTSNNEGRPMVLVEAQQFGVVPTAFNSFASVTDLIQDGKNGLLIKPFSIKEYASKLDWLMTHENERRKMALNAMESVQQFDVKSVVDKWEEVIKSLINR